MKTRIWIVFALLTQSAVQCPAAEDFNVRYNIAGSIGGEMFAPPIKAGLVSGIAFTKVAIDKITGGDGAVLKTSTPAGVLALPSPVPSQLYPSYATNQVVLSGTGTMALWNFGLGYITDENYASGRIGFALNIPYGTVRQNSSPNATTPALNWPVPNAPDGVTRSMVGSQFSSNYQAALSSAGADGTGEVGGVGDIEAQIGWIKETRELKILAGTSVVAPTGNYRRGAAPTLGFGNFYTLRPAVQASYLPTENFAVSGKITLGFNGRNRDNQLRSGNWAGIEGALGYMTSVGPVGLHWVRVQQFQDDSGNPYGAARLLSNNFGLFLTTKLPLKDVAITLQTMKTFDSKYSKAGTFMQIRLIKLFQ